MKTLVKNVKGINIFFEALPEELSLSEHLPEETPESIEKIAAKNEIFCAKVTAWAAGIELASDYLGGCIYPSHEDFYKAEGDYFDDMVANVIEKAKEELPKIIKELSKIKL